MHVLTLRSRKAKRSTTAARREGLTVVTSRVRERGRVGEMGEGRCEGGMDEV
jgi:hypothetical protein